MTELHKIQLVFLFDMSKQMLFLTKKQVYYSEFAGYSLFLRLWFFSILHNAKKHNSIVRFVFFYTLLAALRLLPNEGRTWIFYIAQIKKCKKFVQGFFLHFLILSADGFVFIRSGFEAIVLHQLKRAPAAKQLCTKIKKAAFAAFFIF